VSSPARLVTIYVSTGRPNRPWAARAARTAWARAPPDPAPGGPPTQSSPTIPPPTFLPIGDATGARPTND
jgi:hypothetical protein